MLGRPPSPPITVQSTRYKLQRCTNIVSKDAAGDVRGGDSPKYVSVATTVESIAKVLPPDAQIVLCEIVTSPHRSKVMAWISLLPLMRPGLPPYSRLSKSKCPVLS